MRIDTFIDDFLPNSIYKRAFLYAYLAAIESKGVGGRNKNTFRLGAVLYNKKKIIVSKYNSYKTNPLLIKYTKYPHLHAEQAVIVSKGFDNCKGMSMCVVRIGKDLQIRNARPCKVCRVICKEVGIKQIAYSTSTGMGVVLWNFYNDK